MAIFRSKIYYPKDEVITGLYTRGREYMTLNDEEYVGPYHAYSDGAIYSGGNFVKGKSFPLVPYRLEEPKQNLIYDKVAENEFPKYLTIQHSLPEITEENYKKGYVTRYFAKKHNNINSPIIEISEEMYNEIKTMNYSSSYLYKIIELKWKISGKINDTYTNNVRIESGVVDTNRRTLAIKEKEMVGISDHLNNLTQYYKK